MANGLLDFDPAEMQQLMAQFGATPEERRDANKQALFALGFGLLQGRKGQELASIGAAGANALGYRNQLLSDIPRQKLESVGQAAKLMQLSQQMQQQRALQDVQGKVGAAFTGGPDLGAMGPGGPTPANAAAVAPPSQIEQYRKAAAVYAANGMPDKAKILNDIANSMEEEYSTSPQMMRDEQGKLVSALVGKRGNLKTLPMTQAEKLALISTGGRAGVGVDPYSGQQMSAGLPMTMDPAQIDASKRGWAGLSQAERHFQQGQANTGPIIETATGFARVGKDNKVTPIVADGLQLQPKPTGAIAQQIAQNNVTLGKIDRAMAMVEKTPGAFGLKNLVGDPVSQRINPSGVEARAMVADIAGQKIHDRSGAAVTVGEAERLKPYVPNVTDTPAVVKKKLQMFKQEYRAMQEELTAGRSIAAVAGTVTGGVTGGWSIQEVK